MIAIGNHVGKRTLREDVARNNLGAAQIFLSSNRSYKSPKIEFWEPLGIPLYIHSPYLLNPSSSNPEVREKTTTALQGQIDAAEAAHADGVIVHAGHCAGGTIEQAAFNWATVLEQIDMKVPILVENMAGGKASPGRSLEGWKTLWEWIGDYNVGVCLDTCHAWAGGLELETLANDMRSITGRIDLVHANGSKDEFNSGRDHHSTILDSSISFDLMTHFIEEADAPVILETPRDVAKELRVLGVHFQKSVVR